MSILLAILLLGILVTIHEFGHFISARSVGIEVMEFSIGFGPKLLGWKDKRGTDFSLRALPLGGYCAFYGEDDAKGATQGDPRAYSAQPVWKRMFSVLMGPGMNFLLAFVVAVLFFWIGGVSHVTAYEPVLADVSAGSPAAAAGLKPGDVITAVNGADVLDGTTETLMKALAAYQAGEDPLRLTVRRKGESFETALTPFFDEGADKYRIGVSIAGLPTAVDTQPVDLLGAIRCGRDWCWRSGTAILDSLRQLISGKASLKEAAGPVGVISMVSTQVRQKGFEGFLNLLVFISINLGIVNLMPIPGLDGSRFLFMLLEAVRRKAIPPQKEAVVHLAGYVLLLGLMVVLTYQDVLRLFR